MSRRFDQTLSLLDIFRAVIKYRWRALGTFILMMALAVVAIVLFPKKYESESKLFVRLGRGSVTMDTAATTGQTIAIQESRESEINSVVDMLESRQLTEAVVRSVGADRLLKKYSLVETTIDDLMDKLPELSSDSAPGDDDDERMTEEEVEEQEAVELAIKYLQKNTLIKSPKKSTTVTVTCRARTPRLAREIATTMLDEYEKLHLSAYQASGSFAFFNKNFREHDELVKSYEDEMREAKNSMALITIGGKQQSLQAQITDVEKDIALAEASLAAAKASQEDLEKDMGELPAEIAGEATSGIANVAADTMRSQLYDLEIREKELVSKYKPGHPVLTKLQEQLKQSRSVLTEQEPERETNTTSPNPVRQDAHVLLLQEKAKRAGLIAKIKALRVIQNDLHDQLKKVNLFEVKAAELQRKIDLANQNHRTYAKKLEESRISGELDSEAITNVSVVQPPTFTMKHVSPKRSVLGLLGSVFSVIAAVFVAVVSDRYREDEIDERDVMLVQAEERLLRMKAAEWEALQAKESAARLAQTVPASAGGTELAHRVDQGAPNVPR